MGSERVGWPLKIPLPASRLHITKKGRRRRRRQRCCLTKPHISQWVEYYRIGSILSEKCYFTVCICHVGILTCDQGKKPLRHFVAVVQWYVVQQAQRKEQALSWSSKKGLQTDLRKWYIFYSSLLNVAFIHNIWFKALSRYIAVNMAWFTHVLTCLLRSDWQ